MKIISLAAAVAAALVALSGCVAYPAHRADSSYSRGYYGSDADWQRQHSHRDQWNRYHENDDRDSSPRR
jgi:uncharacterized protein YceK